MCRYVDMFRGVAKDCRSHSERFFHQSVYDRPPFVATISYVKTANACGAWRCATPHRLLDAAVEVTFDVQQLPGSW